MAKKDVTLNVKITESMYRELVYLAGMNETTISNIVRSSIKEVHSRHKMNDIHFGDLTMVPLDTDLDSIR